MSGLHWLDTLCDKVCNRVAAYMAKRRHSYQEFVLQDKLNKVRSDRKFLQLQLTKTRADLYELQRKPQDLRDTIAKILLMSDEELKKVSRLPVRKSESGPGWETVTGFCCLGGCDMDVRLFQAERDALLFSVLLKEVGYQAPHNVACSACYEKYMAENLGGVDSYAE